MSVLYCIGGVFAVLSVFVFFIGIYSLIHTAQFLSKAQTTTGVVSKIDSAYDSQRQTTSYSMLVQFNTDDGKQSEAWIPMDPSTFSEGQSLEIVYDPSKPTYARLNQKGLLYAGSIKVIVLSLVFVIFGYLVFFTDILK